uniref:Acetyltransferase (GNAT) domain-containing protein n=1 Tax=Candidatus Kentrum sp. SD TaxID=2126332 RepID=A0A450YR70_9GAMM|nr:MAG: Acetyltransferase (GNAT) domain-containing protein [Candidatus Kentron sp. SD]VFK44023.1 MAG: Acetyltransferase (GNAT) domain-containing protein [Candidatus Kentron sp. SD]
MRADSQKYVFPIQQGMQNHEVDIIEGSPTPNEYNLLRKAVGWHCIDPERTEVALRNSLFSVYARRENQVVGFGRVVGDYSIYFYVQDILVSPKHQRKGIGHGIMKRLMEYCDSHASAESGACIGLMAAPGLSAFYHRYGFQFLSDGSLFMCSWRQARLMGADRMGR